MDFGAECSARSICFDVLFLKFSAFNELVGLDGKLSSAAMCACVCVCGGGGVKVVMKVSRFRISKCWQVYNLYVGDYYSEV